MSLREDQVLAQYNKNPRYLSKQFIDSIPWQEVKKYPLPEKFIPIILYMRDIEAFTDIYYKQLVRTPTGQDPIIRRFMDRWLVEEATHAELLNRFLNEAGFDTSDRWFEEARENIPKGYRYSDTITPLLGKIFGERFAAVHMTWGAIQELSTLQGYKRLWELTKHPVLEYILKGIAKEESTHIFFYYTIAKIKLQESKFSQQLSRFLVKNFWQPVGAGIKPKKDSNYIMRELFDSVDAMDLVRTNINGSIERLPGFENFSAITERISSITGARPSALPSASGVN
jgi:hypothetical protein